MSGQKYKWELWLEFAVIWLSSDIVIVKLGVCRNIDIPTVIPQLFLILCCHGYVIIKKEIFYTFLCILLVVNVKTAPTVKEDLTNTTVTWEIFSAIGLFKNETNRKYAVYYAKWVISVYQDID